VCIRCTAKARGSACTPRKQRQGAAMLESSRTSAAVAKARGKTTTACTVAGYEGTRCTPGGGHAAGTVSCESRGAGLAHSRTSKHSDPNEGRQGQKGVNDVHLRQPARRRRRRRRKKYVRALCAISYQGDFKNTTATWISKTPQKLCFCF
jgi:hypothetical protein